MLPADVLGMSSLHKITPLVPFLSVAMIFALGKCLTFLDKTRPSLKTWFLWFIVILVILSNVGHTRYGKLKDDKNIHDQRFRNVHNILDPVLYIKDAGDKTVMAFIAMIPEKASVAASGDLLPQLSERKELYEFKGDLGIGGAIGQNGIDMSYLGADYILLNTRPMEHGSGSNNYDNTNAVRDAALLVKQGLFKYQACGADLILLKNVRR